jgi:hypothetical protein
MNAMLYRPGNDEPIAVLDNVDLFSLNDNHERSPERVYFQTKQLGTGKKQIELVRDERMTLKLEDGRTCGVLLQHSSLNAKGESVGVLRVLDNFTSEVNAEDT